MLCSSYRPFSQLLSRWTKTYRHNHTGKEYKEGIWIDQNKDLLINGKEISKIIRSSLSDNGVRPIRYREKKMLFEDCKKQEEEFEYKVELYFDL